MSASFDFGIRSRETPATVLACTTYTAPSPIRSGPSGWAYRPLPELPEFRPPRRAPAQPLC